MKQCGYILEEGEKRVGGVIEPTRTIGDRDIKEDLPPGTISAIPDTRGIDVRVAHGDSAASFFQGILIQGTDGLWDGITGELLLEFLNDHSRGRNYECGKVSE